MAEHRHCKDCDWNDGELGFCNAGPSPAVCFPDRIMCELGEAYYELKQEKVSRRDQFILAAMKVVMPDNWIDEEKKFKAIFKFADALIKEADK